VHRHEVRLRQQRVEVDQTHPHLRGPAGLDVGVVGDHAHPEGAQPLRDEHPDPAEPDDAHGLLVELDTGVARTLPLAVAQGGVRRADVPSRGEHERHRELRGADDVGGRGVDHHHPALGRGADVDVVETHAGAGDDLEPAGRGERLGVDLGAAAHQDRVGVGDRGQEGRPVGAVAVPDLEVRPERVDRGGAELFGDQDDGPRAGRVWGLGHKGGPHVLGSGWPVHDAVPVLDTTRRGHAEKNLPDSRSAATILPWRSEPTPVKPADGGWFPSVRARSPWLPRFSPCPP